MHYSVLQTICELLFKLLKVKHYTKNCYVSTPLSF